MYPTRNGRSMLRALVAATVSQRVCHWPAISLTGGGVFVQLIFEATSSSCADTQFTEQVAQLRLHNDSSGKKFSPFRI